MIFFFTHSWLSELNWLEHFLLSSSLLLYATWLFSFISLSSGWSVGFSFEVHWTLFLFGTSLSQGLLTLIFLWLFFEAQTSKRIRAVNSSALWQIETYCQCQHDNNLLSCIWVLNSQLRMELFHFFCAYSCHLTWLVSGSEFLPDHLPVRLQNCWAHLKNVNRMRWWPLLWDSWVSTGISNMLSLRVWLSSNMHNAYGIIRKIKRRRSQRRDIRKWYKGRCKSGQIVILSMELMSFHVEYIYPLEFYQVQLKV